MRRRAGCVLGGRSHPWRGVVRSAGESRPPLRGAGGGTGEQIRRATRIRRCDFGRRMGWRACVGAGRRAGAVVADGTAVGERARRPPGRGRWGVRLTARWGRWLDRPILRDLFWFWVLPARLRAAHPTNRSESD